MRGTTSMVLLAGLTLACAVHAGESAQQDTNVYFNGVKVAIDPTTGRLRQPTAAEMQALRVSVSKAQASNSRAQMPKTRADAHRTIRKMKDGSVMALVSEDMMSSLVATRQADGTMKIGHAGDVTATPEADHE